MIITVVGLTVIIIGICLLVLPGPGILIIFAGVAILGLEFAWARRLVERGRRAGAKIMRKKKSG